MLKLFTNAHEFFFDNDMGNKVTMGVGFAMSATCILLVLGLYQL